MTTPKHVLLTNCSRIASGYLDTPTLAADSILISDGRIAQVGTGIDAPDGAMVVDANGLDAVPGMIDSHIHPTFGDWSDRMKTSGWLRAYSQAGVTTAISHGAFLLEGYPSDPQGMLALGVTLARAYRGFRPGGMKVHAAAISLVEGLEEADFEYLQREGVWLIAEIGVHSLVDPRRVHELLDLAHRHGFVSRVHFGPLAVDGSATMSAEVTAMMGVQIAAHVNGGPTAAKLSEVESIMDGTDCWLELCYTGNHRAAADIAVLARERGALHRLMLGSDSPTGGGVLPRAILRLANLLACFAGIPAPEAVAIATGNAARAYGLNTGRIEPEREADILLIDAPRDSQADGGLAAIAAGDLPSIAMLMIDGRVVSWQTENTLPGRRQPRVIEPGSDDEG